MQRIKRWRRQITGFLLIIGVIVARGCVFRSSTDFPGSHFNRGSNAIWLGVEWVNEKHTSDEITTLANNLRQRQIRSVFVYTSYLRADGEFSTSYTYAAAFVASLKQAYPELHVLAWIGLPLKNTNGSSAYHVDLSDPATRQKIVTFCVGITSQAEFDGVHLDPEPIHSGDDNILMLLDEMRAALPPDTLLSMAGRRIWPVYPDAPWPLIGQAAWRGDYYREVANRVDQIAVMVYDSGLPLAWIYRQWVRFEVISISRALEGVDIELLIGVPTSEEATATHQPRAENMRSGLQGTINGLNDKAARPQEIDGVAIYPAWETDDAEWKTYESLWLGTN
jgi:hypothetical protein